MKRNRSAKVLLFAFTILFASLACGIQPNIAVSPTVTLTSTPAPTPTALFPAPVSSGQENPDEPTSIVGKIPYTSPFFLNSATEPFVMLEDEAGFVHRDRNFQFPLAGQNLGPVIIHDDKSLTYELSLPAVPQGTFVDVDNNGKADAGVQIFAVAYWDNKWGGPFLEERDGTGWSSAYSSTITDPYKQNEISGGTLIVWAPDDKQSFPTGFGLDGKLFTADDPVAAIPAGYTLVELNQKPFRFYKQARPELDLNEGVGAVNDYSKLSYVDAFDAFFKKVSREYPFTVEKGIDWQALYNRFKPQVARAKNDQDFYRVLRDFSYAIPDAHVGVSPDPQVFAEILAKERSGGFGLILTELSDGRVMATDVLPGLPADKAGIQRGAEILSWNGKSVQQAIGEVIPNFFTYSTELTRHLAQVIFLTHVPPDTSISLSYKNPGELQDHQTTMQAVTEIDSLFKALGYDNQPILPIEASILQPSGLGYLRINTFEDDFRLMAQLWERYLQEFNDNKVPGIIIDMRRNIGGNPRLANNFAGYFFDNSFVLLQESYYNPETGKFESQDKPQEIKPAPFQYSGPIAVLVGPDCVSACELFSYALQHDGRSIVVGNFPSAGGAGEVGRGQYKLPGGLTVQFPTGRPETPDGKVPIEGVGVVPDVKVPVTEKSALGEEDGVLQAAIQSLMDKLK